MSGGSAGDAGSGPVMAGWVSRADLARRLGVTVWTLNRWAAQGIGPVHIRVGLKAYYRASAVDEWLATLERRNARDRQ